MPQLVALHKRKADKGLAVIGMHVQNATDEEITEVSNKLKIKFPVTKGGNSGPVNFSGIPHSAVFDSAGKLVFQGHPSSEGFEKAVNTALRGVASSGGLSGLAPSKTENKPAVLIPEREWTNAEGKKMSAALLSVSGDTGTFKMKNGKTFTYSISKLSEQDQSDIKEATAPKEEEKKE